MIGLIDILETIYDRETMPQVGRSEIDRALDVMDNLNIRYEKIRTAPDKFRASQKYVYRDKIEKIAKELRDVDNINKMTPIIVSKDWHIVDGHHRWGGLFVARKNKQKVPTIRFLDYGRDEAIKLYNRIADMVN